MKITDQEMADILIIGGGPVGLFTAFYAGLRQAKVTLLDSLEALGGQPTHLYPEQLIYDIPAYPKISGKDLGERLIEQLNRFDTKFGLGEEALELRRLNDHPERPSFEVTTQKNKYYARSVIIAAGNGAFQPRRLPIEDADVYEGKQLHYYANNIEQFIDKRVAIFGGGDSAVDWALTLEPLAEEVILVHRRDRFRAMEHSVAQLQNSSVKIFTPYVPSKILGDGKVLTGVRLNKPRSVEYQDIDVDHVLVSYGFVSSIGQIAQWGLDIERNSILVDQQYETNIPGVFAVGDIADYPGKVKIIASGFGEAPQAVNNALVYKDPDNIQPTMHSTSLI